MGPIDRTLLEMYINGECSPAEELIVCRWLDENDIDAYSNVHGERKNARRLDAGWRQLTQLFEELRIATPRERLSQSRPMWWMAAAILGMLLTGGAFTYYFRTNSYEKVYETSYGEVRSINLGDGTTVTLNARTILKISGGFGKKHRKVQLLGEACFKVGQQMNMPFEVQTGMLSVTALGTTFNVMAFPGEPEVAISLTEGKVLVKGTAKRSSAKDVILLPGDEAVYTKNNDRIQTGKFNSWKRLAWKKMIICFENADIHEVLNKLERFYGASFDTSLLKPRPWQLTGEYANATLQDVLESLSFNYDLKYQIKNGKVILYEP